MNNIYGLSALMEAIECANRESEIIEEIDDAVYESGSCLDLDIDPNDSVEDDMDGVGDDVDAGTIDKIIDLLDDDDDDDIDESALEAVDALIETYLM